MAIELDEPSHGRPERQARDDDVRAILAAAGLRLLGALISRRYGTRGLEASLAKHLPR